MTFSYLPNIYIVEGLSKLPFVFIWHVPSVPEYIISLPCGIAGVLGSKLIGYMSYPSPEPVFVSCSHDFLW